jgi:hypothetical protein
MAFAQPPSVEQEAGLYVEGVSFLNALWQRYRRWLLSSPEERQAVTQLLATYELSDPVRALDNVLVFECVHVVLPPRHRGGGGESLSCCLCAMHTTPT